MENTIEYIGKKISEFREQQNISPVELAEKSNLSLPQIYRVENGKHNPTFETIIAICNALNIEIADVLPRSERKQSANLDNDNLRYPNHHRIISDILTSLKEVENTRDLLIIQRLLGVMKLEN